MNEAGGNALRTGCRLNVRGIVQGVGFRPYVWRLASELGLTGWVRNDADGVEIALCGDEHRIAQFVRRLCDEAPPLARIDAVDRQADTRPLTASDFRIRDSRAGEVRTAIGPDSAVCSACLAELFDPAQRRYRHAFITCTHCGPRYTIARGLPYDREKTSLAPFPLCTSCRSEYENPADRRFHAESTCCPDCGPRLQLRGIDGTTIAGDAVAETLRLLMAGKIVALKGLGGFHLACDARNALAVAALRQRKARQAKPFAVMTVSLAVLADGATASEEDRRRLHSAAAPVVLLDQLGACNEVLPGVAPGLGALGVMLPNTPLQHLLFHEAAGRPAGVAWIAQAPPDLVLVMTSANPQGEPLVIDDAEALPRLAGIADAVLGHDRAIVARADDSVWRGGVFIRRGRGYTPQALRLPRAGPAVLAFGGWFKNTICVTRGDEAFVSTHIGDLDNTATCGFLDETVERMLALTGIEPALVAHDRHPDFYSTLAARRFAAERSLPVVAVQHHHAHLAAVAAEHGIGGPAFGLALDGVGLGDDGTAWGGELLAVDGASLVRAGHLAPLALPGGDRAARQPWRMGAAALWALGRGEQIEGRYAAQPGAATIRQMLERGVNCPQTTSAGRYFDAAAGLLGISPLLQFEAQAAMQLEALAESYGPCEPLPGGWVIRAGVLDLLPLLAELADETDKARGAAVFHATLAAALAEWVSEVALSEKSCKPRAMGSSGNRLLPERVLLAGGGCWLNRRLARDVASRLAEYGIALLLPRRLPPGDGGLAFGQAAVAMASMSDI